MNLARTTIGRYLYFKGKLLLLLPKTRDISLNDDSRKGNFADLPKCYQIHLVICLNKVFILFIANQGIPYVEYEWEETVNPD
jgi:hypothetical protein